MSIHTLNCLTVKAYYPREWETGALCLLMETERGLLLIDTGPGLGDYARVPIMMRALALITKMPMNPAEAAVCQVTTLGYDPADVVDVVLTHMHFDHCGGLPDFPQARVHVHRKEYEAFQGPPRSFLDLAYVERHLAHDPELLLYEETDDHWFDFPAVRLPFEREIWLIPLSGHTRGHCGMAIRTGDGGSETWHFHVGGSVPIGFSRALPAWLTRLMVGPHEARVRAFRTAHPEMTMTTTHMPLSFFEQHPPAEERPL